MQALWCSSHALTCHGETGRQWACKGTKQPRGDEEAGSFQGGAWSSSLQDLAPHASRALCLALESSPHTWLGHQRAQASQPGSRCNHIRAGWLPQVVDSPRAPAPGWGRTAHSEFRASQPWAEGSARSAGSPPGKEALGRVFGCRPRSGVLNLC